MRSVGQTALGKNMPSETLAVLCLRHPRGSSGSLLPPQKLFLGAWLPALQTHPCPRAGPFARGRGPRPCAPPSLPGPSRFPPQPATRSPLVLGRFACLFGYAILTHLSTPPSAVASGKPEGGVKKWK